MEQFNEFASHFNETMDQALTLGNIYAEDHFMWLAVPLIIYCEAQ